MIGALCDIGKVKKSNQDSILIKIGSESNNEFGLFVVADGLGGLAHGEQASLIAVEEFRRWWEEELSTLLYNNIDTGIETIDRQVDLLILKINEKILEYSGKINARVGTTLSMLFIFKDRYIIKHIGDSRIYIMNGCYIKQMTEDHSWVAQQVREGKLSSEAAKVHPKRHILEKCLGVSADISIFEYSDYVHQDDLFLLCSDGFYNHLKEDEIMEAIQEYLAKDDGEIQDVVKSLLDKIMDRGARDNISLIIVQQDYSEAEKEAVSLGEVIKRLFNIRK